MLVNAGSTRSLRSPRNSFSAISSKSHSNLTINIDNDYIRVEHNRLSPYLENLSSRHKKKSVFWSDTNIQKESKYRSVLSSCMGKHILMSHFNPIQFDRKSKK